MNPVCSDFEEIYYNKKMLRLIPIISPIIFYIAIFALGAITPGYSHVKNTISRLAIEKYGILQQINFLQLSFALLLSGKYFTHTLQQKGQRKYIDNIFMFSAFLLIVAALIPTDKIETATFNISLFSPFGLIHLSIVLLFIIFSPFGIYHLYKIFQSEEYYKGAAGFTLFMGTVTLIMSILWIAFFISGLFLDYRGLFQKIIALWATIWLVTINWRVYKYKNPSDKH